MRLGPAVSAMGAFGMREGGLVVWGEGEGRGGMDEVRAWVVTVVKKACPDWRWWEGAH